MDRNPVQLPLTSWSGVGEHGHGVQFYSKDSSLATLLTGYVGGALVSGHAAVVIATPAHLDGLASCLKSRGFDPEIATREGRYIPLNAQEVLAQLCTNGRINRARFENVTLPILKRARAATGDDRSHVAAFGEMVALLWMAGLTETALELEHLWNGLLQRYPFSLCCAYPMAMFDSLDAGPFLRVCAQHSHVFPAEHKPAVRYFAGRDDIAAAADRG